MEREERTAGTPPDTLGPAFVRTLEDLLITLRRSSKDLAFYPLGHPQLSRSLERALGELRDAVGARATLQLTVSRTGFAFEGRPVGPENRQLATMADELFVRRIQQIFFAPGVEVAELTAFLRVITADPKTLLQQGGPGNVLSAQGVARIQVNEFDFRRLSGAASLAERKTATVRMEAQEDGTAQALEREWAGPAKAPDARQEAQPTAEALVAASDAQKTAKEQTVEALIRRLEQEAASGGPAGYEWAALRLEAAAGLAMHEDRTEEVLAILRVFLRHQQAENLKPAVRQQATQAVEGIAAGGGAEYLVQRLSAGAEGSVEELSGVLAGLGPRVVPPLLERLSRADVGGARDLFVTALARISEVAQPEVTQALQQADRDRASRLARNIGEAGGEAVVTLLACLARHREVRVRCEAVRGLGRSGGAPALRHLLQALRDPHPAVLEMAVGFLATAKVKLAAPTLLRLARQRALKGQLFAVRKAAVAALGAMGDPGFIAILTKLLYTRTWFRRSAGNELRQTAALAMLHMGCFEAQQVVEAGLQSRRRDVRRACDAALRKLAAAAPVPGVTP